MVLQDLRVVAFHDVNPQAPVHVLVVPRMHVADVDGMAAADPSLGGELLAVCARVASILGLAGGYRVVANNGAGAGQSVFHLHLHVLGGRALVWPPG